MLALRPNCEICDKDLPAHSTEAMICSYECTYCKDCVEQYLHNVCTNCGGSLAPRPIRPRQSYRPGVGLEFQPAQDQRVHTRWSMEEIKKFTAQLIAIAPELR
ncbi:DUF1272 domain-containing protein [Aurantivibrio plasticivorans]